MRFYRVYVAAMHGGNEDRATRVLSLTNEEPLVVVEAGVDMVWEVIGKDHGNCSDCVVREREASLCRGRYQFGREGPSCTENGDGSCNGIIGGHRGLKVLSLRSSNVHIVRVNGDIVVERGEKKGIKQLLSDMRGSRRHCMSDGLCFDNGCSYNRRRPGFRQGIFG